VATEPNKRICIVGGAGHVGLPLALVLADEGFTVDILDTNAEALKTIKAGRMPFIESGAEDLLKRLLPTGRLTATSDASAVDTADIVICVIGTPVDEYLTPQAHTFYRVIGEISPHFQDGQTLILRSTVYPGLSQRVHDLFHDRGINVHVTFCPERIAQGHSIRELRIIPQIISGFDDEGLRVVRELFSRVTSEIIEVKPQEAELAKLFCNSYRYIQFAVANQFYLLSREAGLDFERVHHAATYKNGRVDSLPRAGLAAGPCLLKDTMQLAAFSNNNFMLGHAAMLINEGQPQFLVNMLKRRVNLRDKSVGLLGMTFKADCDDTRDSLSFLRLVGRIQGDRQSMREHGIVRSERRETTIGRHRFALATQSGVGGHVQGRQIFSSLAAVAQGCRNLECRRRLARVQIVANQKKGGPRKGRGALDCPLQQGHGLGAATCREQ